MECDVLVVGAGFAGLVMAERLSSIGKKCIVIDRRNHIGGNAYDKYDDAGVLIHPYGPHLFHTNSDKVYQYLSRFTKWIPASYKVFSYTDGKYWSFPINLKTFEQLTGTVSTEEDMKSYLEEYKIPISHPKNSEEAIISKVGWELYEKFYKGYTIKQWQRHPKELDASVCSRIPIRTNRNDSLFDDTYQCMPRDGYTAMFNKMMLDYNISIFTGVDYRKFYKSCKYKHLVFTGPIDEFFDYEYGHLPYRSLRFENESFNLNGKFWQPTVSVNYPNDGEFTRIFEIKHVTGQQCDSTTIIKEYPENYVIGREAYYPVPAPDSALIYSRYKEMAEQCKDVTFVGRLATYSYLNMDQCVGQALSKFEKLRRKL